MNLADYLSELLSQHDEVSVPGLGYFVRTRVSAYFNEAEARFYPPFHQVKFVNKPKDDDTFAQYVADKKNISLASSKYFIEKFIGKLKEDAGKGKYLFADLGSFRTEADQLVFKPNDKIAGDPAFYGYPPVDIYRIGQPISADTRRPVLVNTQTIATTQPPGVSPPPVATVADDHYYEEETEQKRRMSVWLIILISLAALGVICFGIYKFYPEVYLKAKWEFYKLTGRELTPAEKLQDALRLDSAKIMQAFKDAKAKAQQQVTPAKDTAARDTTATAAQPATDSTAVPPSHFEIIIGGFSNQQMADAALNYYKRRGVTRARLLNADAAPGPHLKLSAGTYLTNDSAETVRLSLVAKHLLKPNAYVLEIKPKQ